MRSQGRWGNNEKWGNNGEVRQQWGSGATMGKWGNTLKARGGGKRHFFSFYICDRAAEDEQVEKNRIKIRPCIPEILHAKV